MQKSLIFSTVNSWDLCTNSKMFCFSHNFLRDIALIQFYKKHHLLTLCPNSPCKRQKTKTNYFQPQPLPNSIFWRWTLNWWKITPYIGFHAYQIFPRSFLLSIWLNHFTSFRSHKLQIIIKKESTIKRFLVYKEYHHYSFGLSHLSSHAKEHTVTQLTPGQK